MTSVFLWGFGILQSLSLYHLACSTRCVSMCIYILKLVSKSIWFFFFLNKDCGISWSLFVDVQFILPCHKSDFICLFLPVIFATNQFRLCVQVLNQLETWATQFPLCNVDINVVKKIHYYSWVKNTLKCCRTNTDACLFL